MPCNSDYLSPQRTEIEMSRVLCLLDELNGRQWSKEQWAGLHGGAYGQNLQKRQRDALVAKLCQRLQSVDVTKYSLELQMWWRDHKEADKKRVEQEVAAARFQAERAAVIAKLTPYERELLGVREKTIAEEEDDL